MTAAKAKRRYYRHPIECPIEITEMRWKRRTTNQTINISDGGVCFPTVRPMARGSEIQVSIPVQDRLFKLRARVAYSKKNVKTGLFSTGVSFQDEDSLYRAKLAEELLCIERFQESLIQKTGETISVEDAAKKWIHKKAKQFATFFEKPMKRKG